MARKFIYFIAIMIGLFIVAALTYRLFPMQIMRAALVPAGAFEAPPALPANAYANADMWVARPDMKDNPAKWLPTGVTATPAAGAAVFFIHPTSSFNRNRWNAPFDDRQANDGAALSARAQASVFSAAGDIWMPHYRQATFGAFLTDAPEAKAALDAAYRDVATAFDAFISGIDPKRPIILAGHSQGSLYLLRLLREKIAGTPTAKRIVAAYAIGWPISVRTDLTALGMAACVNSAQTGCLLSWQSFAEPAEPDFLMAAYNRSTGFDGTARKDSMIVCTNPLNGGASGAQPASANLGTLKTNNDATTGTLTAKAVPARCDPRGLLLVGDAPDVGNVVLPGNNYHVYDYNLFWLNVRADAVRRVATFHPQ